MENMEEDPGGEGVGQFGAPGTTPIGKKIVVNTSESGTDADRCLPNSNALRTPQMFRTPKILVKNTVPTSQTKNNAEKLPDVISGKSQKKRMETGKDVLVDSKKEAVDDEKSASKQPLTNKPPINRHSWHSPLLLELERLPQAVYLRYAPQLKVDISRNLLVRHGIDKSTIQINMFLAQLKTWLRENEIPCHLRNPEDVKVLEAIGKAVHEWETGRRVVGGVEEKLVARPPKRLLDGSSDSPSKNKQPRQKEQRLLRDVDLGKAASARERVETNAVRPAKFKEILKIRDQAPLAKRVKLETNLDALGEKVVEHVDQTMREQQKTIDYLQKKIDKVLEDRAMDENEEGASDDGEEEKDDSSAESSELANRKSPLFVVNQDDGTVFELEKNGTKIQGSPKDVKDDEMEISAVEKVDKASVPLQAEENGDEQSKADEVCENEVMDEEQEVVEENSMVDELVIQEAYEGSVDDKNDKVEFEATMKLMEEVTEVTVLRVQEKGESEKKAAGVDELMDMKQEVEAADDGEEEKVDSCSDPKGGFPRGNSNCHLVGNREPERKLKEIRVKTEADEGLSNEENGFLNISSLQERGRAQEANEVLSEANKTAIQNALNELRNTLNGGMIDTPTRDELMRENISLRERCKELERRRETEKDQETKELEKMNERLADVNDGFEEAGFTPFHQSWIDEIDQPELKKLIELKGRTVGSGDQKYEINEIIGAGTFGVVFGAKDARTGGLAAVKLVADPGAFNREIEIMERMKGLDLNEYVCIPSCFFKGSYKKISYRGFPMEFLPIDLFSLTHLEEHRHKKFPPASVLTILAQIFSAISYLNENGKVYSDLKGDNVMMKSYNLEQEEGKTFIRNPVIRLIDFNSTFPIGASASFCQPTPFRAPEVILGAAFDERIDSFSCGLLAVELLEKNGVIELQDYDSTDERQMLEHISRMEAFLGSKVPSALWKRGTLPKPERLPKAPKNQLTLKSVLQSLEADETSLAAIALQKYIPAFLQVIPDERPNPTHAFNCLFEALPPRSS